MSISSEITRITNARDDIGDAIEEMGVTVASGTHVDGMASLIRTGVTSHIQDYNNPHQVTPGQVGGIYYGICETGADVADKTVTISGITSLYDGLYIRVKFLYGNNKVSPYLNLNSLGYKPIWTDKNHPAEIGEWSDGTVLDLIYVEYESSSNLNGWRIVNSVKADTSRFGRVKLSTSVNSNDATVAATASAVKKAYDLASAVEQQIAVIEATSTASKDYRIGERFCWNDVLYKAKTAISTGDTFVSGTNCEPTTVDAELGIPCEWVVPSNALFTSISGSAHRIGNVVFFAFQATTDEALANNTEILRIPYHAPTVNGQVITLFLGSTANTARINGGTLSSVPYARFYTNTAVSAGVKLTIAGSYFIS